MSEPPDTLAPDTLAPDTLAPDTLATAGEARAAQPKAPGPPRNRRVLLGLAGAVLAIVAVVASAPFWAPLLPWAPGASVPVSTDTAPAGRVAAAQQETRQPSQPQTQPQAQERGQHDVAAVNAAVQQLDRRVGALEARPAAPVGDIADLRQQVARLASGAADLDARIAAIDKAVAAQAALDKPGAVDTTDMGLVLALLQIRGALEVGRPFAAEYETLAGLARARPEIAAAASPLAGPATSGLATRAVLANRLRELAGAIATAKAPQTAPANASEAAPDWTDQVLLRLRGLVTVRRIDGVSERPLGEGSDAAVNAAARALAGGDLEGAVGALDKLTGAPAEAASPWLRMARERLAAEAALSRIEALLVARLGRPAGAPGAGSSR
jgi:hypothetical protein